MSHRDLLNSTSRTAMIFGMTNTDQVGQWQALAPVTVARRPEPEVLPDSGDGGGDNLNGDGGDNRDPETGLTAEESAEFEAMRTGEPPPAGDPADDLDPDGDADVDDTTDPAEPAPAAAPRVPKTAAQLAAEAQTGKRAPGEARTISVGKHKRELKAAQDAVTAANTALAKEREDRIKLGERVAIINEALQARAAEQAAPAADPNAPPENPFDEADINPEEDYAASVLQERRRNRYAYEASQQTRQQVTESSADTQLRDTFTRDMQAVAAQPEYSYLPQAYQYLKDSRLTQIFLSEFDKDPNDENESFTPQEIAQGIAIFNAEEKWLVGNAVKANKSPAHAILKQAKVYGFRPTAPAAPAAAPAAVPPARLGAIVPARRPAPPAAPLAPVAPSAAQALEELRANQEAAKSLSDGGGAPPQGLSAELLLALDDDQFAEMIDSMSPHQLNAIMGRTPG